MELQIRLMVSSPSFLLSSLPANIFTPLLFSSLLSSFTLYLAQHIKELWHHSSLLMNHPFFLPNLPPGHGKVHQEVVFWECGHRERRCKGSE